MKNIVIKHIKRLKEGKISEAEFFKILENFPYMDIGEIKLDFHRNIRRGVPEAIYGSGKSVDQLIHIVKQFAEMKEVLIITRLKKEIFSELKAGCHDIPLLFHEKAQVVTFDQPPQVKFNGSILIVSAGASDASVAEEAFACAGYLGNKVEKVYDVGVACLARVLDLKESLKNYSVIIVVAGMEGALPSVVAGLTSTPIIAVPTSVGYGANFKGVSALLAMLNTCAGGVSVVNIDNGFGAAYQATLINQKITESTK